jgi:translation initiation factor 2B subunit (eIF-2B alpha/beta/delta family)
MVGADTLSPYGLVNKIGTFGLAVASKEFRKDFYTLCSTDKILPKRGTIEDEKDPLEITSKCLPNVTPINRYFDLTPLTYLTGVVTEKGIMTPSEIKEYMKGLKIHRLLSDFSLNPSSS